MHDIYTLLIKLVKRCKVYNKHNRNIKVVNSLSFYVKWVLDDYGDKMKCFNLGMHGILKAVLQKT